MCTCYSKQKIFYLGLSYFVFYPWTGMSSSICQWVSTGRSVVSFWTSTSSVSDSMLDFKVLLIYYINCISFFILFDLFYFIWFCLSCFPFLRPGWERHVIALAWAQVHHIKNSHVLGCIPKTLYGVLPHLFLIHSFSTFSITLFTIAPIKCSVHLSVPHPDVFWYCLNSMGTQKNAPKKFLQPFFHICFM